MTRLEAFKDRCQRYPYAKLAKRLSEADFDRVVAFIEDNDHLAHLEFEYAVNRMFLNDKNRTKNYTIMMELLTVCNTAAKGIHRNNLGENS